MYFSLFSVHLLNIWCTSFVFSLYQLYFHLTFFVHHYISQKLLKKHKKSILGVFNVFNKLEFKLSSCVIGSLTLNWLDWLIFKNFRHILVSLSLVSFTCARSQTGVYQNSTEATTTITTTTTKTATWTWTTTKTISMNLLLFVLSWLVITTEIATITK